MKKITIVSIMILTSYATITQATLKNNTWYTGSKIGWSHFYNTNWYNSSLSNNGPTHKNKFNIGISGGYYINPYIGIEINYDWLGRISYIGNKVNGRFKAHDLQLTTKVNYPVLDYVNVYTRLGGAIWHANSRNNVIGDNYATGLSPVLASGIEWKITNNIDTRLEYQWINNIGNSNIIGLRPDNSTLNLGVFYHFGQQTIALKGVSILRNTLATQTKHLTLKSSILFNFNKATLKLDGQKTLDQLCNQLDNLSSEDNYIVVIGFTDHIGSNIYNQSLSEKRAKSVVDYLISKGIKSNRITACGMGESNRISSSNCDKIHNFSKLINCLSPDRRVEVEIKDI